MPSRGVALWAHGWLNGVCDITRLMHRALRVTEAQQVSKCAAEIHSAYDAASGLQGRPSVRGCRQKSSGVQIAAKSEDAVMPRTSTVNQLKSM